MSIWHRLGSAAEVAALLRETYRDEVVRFQPLIGRDRGSWLA